MSTLKMEAQVVQKYSCRYKNLQCVESVLTANLRFSTLSESRISIFIPPRLSKYPLCDFCNIFPGVVYRVKLTGGSCH